MKHVNLRKVHNVTKFNQIHSLSSSVKSENLIPPLNVVTGKKENANENRLIKVIMS